MQFFNYKTRFFLGLFKCFEPFPRATILPVCAFFTRSNHSGTLRHFLLLRAFFTCNRSATSRHFHTAIILFLARGICVPSDWPFAFFAFL